MRTASPAVPDGSPEGPERQWRTAQPLTRPARPATLAAMMDRMPPRAALNAGQ